MSQYCYNGRWKYGPKVCVCLSGNLVRLLSYRAFRSIMQKMADHLQKLMSEKLLDQHFVFVFLCVWFKKKKWLNIFFQDCIPQYHLGHWKRLGENWSVCAWIVHLMFCSILCSTYCKEHESNPTGHTCRQQIHTLRLTRPYLPAVCTIQLTCDVDVLQRACGSTSVTTTCLSHWSVPHTTASQSMMSSSVDGQQQRGWWGLYNLSV